MSFPHNKAQTSKAACFELGWLQKTRVISLETKSQKFTKVIDIVAHRKEAADKKQKMAKKKTIVSVQCDLIQEKNSEF